MRIERREKRDFNYDLNLCAMETLLLTTITMCIEHVHL